jgi:hypothetical protein
MDLQPNPRQPLVLLSTDLKGIFESKASAVQASVAVARFCRKRLKRDLSIGLAAESIATRQLKYLAGPKKKSYFGAISILSLVSIDEGLYP